MFNIGFSEMLVIAGLALILIGPKQLPEVARNIGRLLNELKRSTNSFTDELKAQVDFDLEEQLRKRRNTQTGNSEISSSHLEPSNHEVSEKKPIIELSNNESKKDGNS